MSKYEEFQKQSTDWSEEKKKLLEAKQAELQELERDLAEKYSQEITRCKLEIASLNGKLVSSFVLCTLQQQLEYQNDMQGLPAYMCIYLQIEAEENLKTQQADADQAMINLKEEYENKLTELTDSLKQSHDEQLSSLKQKMEEDNVKVVHELQKKLQQQKDEELSALREEYASQADKLKDKIHEMEAERQMAEAEFKVKLDELQSENFKVYLTYITTSER